MSKKQDQIDAMTVMNKLSDVDPFEKYANHKTDFWDLNSVDVKIEDLHNARISFCKYGGRYNSYDSRHNTYKYLDVKLGLFNRLFGLTLDKKVDLEIMKLKLKLNEENKKEIELIDLKRKYNPEY